MQEMQLPSFPKPLKKRGACKPNAREKQKTRTRLTPLRPEPVYHADNQGRGECLLRQICVKPAIYSRGKSEMRQTVECACHPLIAQPRCTVVGVGVGGFTRVKIMMRLRDRLSDNRLSSGYSSS
jgi:hypothetical protein